jgi:Spy/CpxP family protein refolding chaperone
MRKFLLALVLGVGMLVPLASPAAAEAHSYSSHSHWSHYEHHHSWHHGYWQNGYWYYHR